MSTDRDTTRIVRSWLRTDEHESADRVLDAVLDQLDTTPQRRNTWWPARRFSEMNQAMRIALASAAVVAVALVGFTFLSGQVGGPNLGGGPESTPTASPIPSPTAYVITNDEGVVITLNLPHDWLTGGWYVHNGGDTTTLTAIQVWAVRGNSHTDPCNWDETALDPPLGPTVDDLVTALENQLTREAVTTDVTLDGYTGQLVKMTVPADAVFADCDLGEFRSWDGRYHQGPGQQDDVYILDVEGFRLVIDALSFPGSSAADLEERQQILDTIQIEPPA